MTIREFEPASASTSHDEPATQPLLNTSVLARMSRPPTTRASRLLVWVLAGLLAAAGIFAAGYWGYRQVQPSPLFTPASASAESLARPAPSASGAPERRG